MVNLTGRLTAKCVDSAEYNTLLGQVTSAGDKLVMVTRDDAELTFQVDLDMDT